MELGQENSMQMAAMCRLTVASAVCRWKVSTQAATRDGSGFTLEIDAPNQLGLHAQGQTQDLCAGMSLSAVDPATAPGSNWEILATGGAAAQGPGRFNIRDLRTGEDIFTIQTYPLGSAADAIGIGTTTPTQKLEVNGAVLAQNFIMSSSRKFRTRFSIFAAT